MSRHVVGWVSGRGRCWNVGFGHVHHVLPHTRIRSSDDIPDKLLSRMCTCSDHGGGSCQERAFESSRCASKRAARLPKSARFRCADFALVIPGLQDAIGAQRGCELWQVVVAGLRCSWCSEMSSVPRRQKRPCASRFWHPPQHQLETRPHQPFPAVFHTSASLALPFICILGRRLPALKCAGSSYAGLPIVAHHC
jgi:hypothetical protein